MNEIANICKELKQNFKPRKTNPSKPVSCWSEPDVVNNEITKAFVIILKTRGCSWAYKSGCSMCGYFNDSLWEEISDENLIKQIDTALERYNNEPFIKIFTSGSFLDEQEINSKLQEKILEKLYQKTEKVSVESRPEYITEKKLNDISKIRKEKTFEIGIGLETSNDIIRQKILNKGFLFKKYIQAAKICTENETKIKTYVLIKPPFLTEKESIDDAIKTVKDIKNITNTISFNPVNIQKNTVVSYLWNRQKYRPPWLFSVVEILNQSNKITNNILLKCDVVAGGKNRGAHNCKKCDKGFLRAIDEFSLKQDEKIFDGLDCECKDKWLDQLDIESLGFGSLIDMYK